MKDIFSNKAIYSILIVEDEFINSEFLRQVLLNLGFENIHNVTNANDALRIAKERKIDFAFMDININGSIDGIMCARLLNQIYELPIIYTTAYKDSETIKEATRTNTYGYLIKPFDEKDIEATCNILLLQLVKENHNVQKTQKKLFKVAQGYLYNLQTNQLLSNGTTIKLSKNETKLLKLFCENINNCVSYESIQNTLWPEKKIADSTLRDTISRLRKKIINVKIESWTSIGYSLKEDQ